MTASTDPDTAAPKDTVVLYCPHCEYNLTGLPEDRCPECGEPFDRNELASTARGQSILPLRRNETPWSSAQWRAFVSMIYRSLFHPASLASEMPQIYFQGEAAELSVHSRLLATMIVFGHFLLWVMLLTMSSGDEAFVAFGPLIVLGAYLWIPSFLLEGLVAAVLNAMLPRKKLSRTDTHEKVTSSWYGLVALHSGFTVAFCTAFCVLSSLLLIAVKADWSHDALNILLFLVFACIFVFPVWWWINLNIGIYVRSASKERAVAAIIAVLVMLLAMAGLMLLVCGLVA